MGLGEILNIVSELIKLEKKIEELLKNESDKRKRKKLQKAIKKARKTGDLSDLRKLLFDL